MLVTSLFVLLAGISIAGHHHFGIGAGALERLAQYPESVWLILFGFYISRSHYRNKVIENRFFKFSEDKLQEPKSTVWRALRESARITRRPPTPLGAGDRVPVAGADGPPPSQ